MRGRSLLLAVSMLLAGFILGSVGTSFAESTFLGFPIVHVTLNGKAIESDVPGVSIAGRTMLPVRALANALNLDVAWNESTSTVALTTKTATETVTFGNVRAVTSGSRINVIGEATNHSDAALTGIAVCAFYDKDGRLLARTRVALPNLLAGQTKTFESISVASADVSGYTSIKVEVSDTMPVR